MTNHQALRRPTHWMNPKRTPRRSPCRQRCRRWLKKMTKMKARDYFVYVYYALSFYSGHY